MNTRKYALEDLVEKYSTKFTLDNCGNSFANGGGGLAHKLHMFNFGSIKPRKTRSKSLQMFNGSLLDSNNGNDIDHMNNIDIEILAFSQSKTNGALFCNIEFIEDFHYSIKDKAYLGVNMWSSSIPKVSVFYLRLDVRLSLVKQKTRQWISVCSILILASVCPYDKRQEASLIVLLDD